MAEIRPKQESPIAASAEAKRLLREISSALGIRQIDLLDQFVKAGREYYEHHGKRLMLPLRFTETFRVFSNETMILEEPPRARSGSDSGAGGHRKNKPTPRAAARG